MGLKFRGMSDRTSVVGTFLFHLLLFTVESSLVGFTEVCRLRSRCFSDVRKGVIHKLLGDAYHRFHVCCLFRVSDQVDEVFGDLWEIITKTVVKDFRFFFFCFLRQKKELHKTEDTYSRTVLVIIRGIKI